MAHRSKLIIVSAPSGAGKTTLVKHLLSVFPTLVFSVSATSRAIRGNEINGKDYFFITKEEFRTKINSGELLEWQEVYPGCFYGTLKNEVNRILNHGKDIIFDVDVVGGLNIKKEFGNRALALFVSPPSIEVLKERLNYRNTDSPAIIKERVEKARQELTYSNKFDFVVINNDLEQAKKEIVKVVGEFLKTNE